MNPRYAARPLDPEKLKEVFLKIRKGATASLTLAQIQAVVQHLGGSITSTVSVIPVDHDRVAVEHNEADEAFARLNAYKATSVPNNPKPGSLFITKLPPFEHQGSLAIMEGVRAYIAVPSLTASLNGKTEVFNTRPRNILRDVAASGEIQTPKPSVFEVIDWLVNEANLVSLVNADLGMEPHVPAVQRTRENTGHCSVCLQNVKLKPGNPPTIVLHGYERPGWGSISGSCFGTRYPPYELSDEGTKAYIDKELNPMIETISNSIRDLNSGKVTELVVGSGQRQKVVKPTDPLWDRYVRQEISDAESRKSAYNRELERAENLVRVWRIRPLPVEGGPPFRLAAVASRVASRYMAR